MTDESTAAPAPTLPDEVDAAVQHLKSVGFVDGDTEAFRQISNEIGLSTKGTIPNLPHTVHGHYVKGDLHAVVEENISADVLGPDPDLIRRHPPVMIFESPKGRVATSTITDLPLLDALIADLG